MSISLTHTHANTSLVPETTNDIANLRGPVPRHERLPFLGRAAAPLALPRASARRRSPRRYDVSNVAEAMGGSPTGDRASARDDRKSPLANRRTGGEKGA